MKYTDKQLLDRVQALPSFTELPKTFLDIWIRSKTNKFNVFDDAVYTYDLRTGEPVFKLKCSGTTNAGALGLKHFDRFGLKGCAVLKADYIQLNSHVYGLHKGKYPAYIENPVSPFPYYRDSDKDEHAEENGQEYHDCIGANCHHAGHQSSFIDGWSIACLVRNGLQQYIDWMHIMGNSHWPNFEPNHAEKFLSIAILNEF